MTTFLVCAAIYFAIPIIAIVISGRKLTWQGWLMSLLVWPFGWLFIDEELP
jgi:hypothetical protein